MAAHASAAGIALDCDGTLDNQGVAMPKDMEPSLVKPQPSGHTYVLEDNGIVIVGTGRIADIRMTLCESTPTQYRYSSDCSITSRSALALDWAAETQLDARTSEFFKKYPSARETTGVAFISIDRYKLQVLEEHYDLYSHPQREQEEGQVSVVPRNYVIIQRFEGSCKIAKPKV